MDPWLAGPWLVDPLTWVFQDRNLALEPGGFFEKDLILVRLQDLFNEIHNGEAGATACEPSLPDLGVGLGGRALGLGNWVDAVLRELVQESVALHPKKRGDALGGQNLSCPAGWDKADEGGLVTPNLAPDHPLSLVLSGAFSAYLPLSRFFGDLYQAGGHPALFRFPFPDLGPSARIRPLRICHRRTGWLPLWPDQ